MARTLIWMPGAPGKPSLYDDMKSCSGVWQHLLLLCASQLVVHRTLGVVNNRGSSAILFATAEGAYDMSLEGSALLYCVVPDGTSRAHTRICIP